MTVSFLLITEVDAQNINDKSPFWFVYDGMKNFDNILAVEFVNPKTKEIYRSYNLADGNPFNKLDFPEKTRNKNSTFRHHKQYDISHLRLKDFKIKNVNLIKNRSLNDTITLNNSILYSSYSYDVYDSVLIIVYNLNLVDQSIMAASNIFYFFNKKGKLIKKINNINHWCNEFAITDDMKYFVCSFGGLDNTLNGYFEKLGYLVYSLTEQETQFIEYFDYNYLNVGVRNYGNIIQIGLVKDDNTEDLIYYKFSVGKKYSKNVSEEVLFKTQNINDNGLIYLKNGVLDTLLFQKDFFKEDIKQEQLSGISNELIKVIDKLDIELIALDQDSILNIYFFSEGDNCFLYIYPSFYYNPDKIIGTYRINDWYVVINSSDESCCKNYLLPKYLRKEVSINTFMTEDELIREQMTVEPYGLKYQIFSDSLVLVYKGFF